VTRRIGTGASRNCASVDADVELLHQPREFVEVIAEEAGESFDTAADRLQRRLLEIVAHSMIGKRLVDFRIEPSHDIRRRSGRCEYAEPLVDHETLHAGLLE